jgi:hypothetical protein
MIFHQMKDQTTPPCAKIYKRFQLLGAKMRTGTVLGE